MPLTSWPAKATSTIPAVPIRRPIPEVPAGTSEVQDLTSSVRRTSRMTAETLLCSRRARATSATSVCSSSQVARSQDWPAPVAWSAPTLGLPGRFPGQRGARVVGQWSLRLSPVGHLVPVGGGGIGRVSSSDDPMNAMVCSLMMMVGTGLSGPPGPSARR